MTPEKPGEMACNKRFSFERASVNGGRTIDRCQLRRGHVGNHGYIRPFHMGPMDTREEPEPPWVGSVPPGPGQKDEAEALACTHAATTGYLKPLPRGACYACREEDAFKAGARSRDAEVAAHLDKLLSDIAGFIEHDEVMISQGGGIYYSADRIRGGVDVYLDLQKRIQAIRLLLRLPEREPR